MCDLEEWEDDVFLESGPLSDEEREQSERSSSLSFSDE
jgi:hypothetical protein